MFLKLSNCEATTIGTIKSQKQLTDIDLKDKYSIGKQVTSRLFIFQFND